MGDAVPAACGRHRVGGMTVTQTGFANQRLGPRERSGPYWRVLAATVVVLAAGMPGQGFAQPRDPFQAAEPPPPRTRGTSPAPQQAPQQQTPPQQAPSQRQTGNPSFTFVNETNDTIFYLYASPHRDPNWGRDHLGSGVLGPGQSFHVPLPPGDCIYDLRIVFRDNRALERRDGVNLCRMRSVNVAFMRQR